MFCSFYEFCDIILDHKECKNKRKDILTNELKILKEV